jgi:division protein CdvB (Snf7/Vps24/ESCRT-III family)
VVRGFTDRWKQKEKDTESESIVSKIKNVGQPTVGLKEQIATVTQRLDVQTRSLDAAVIRFQNRDKEIFGRIIKAMSQRDDQRANILATELAEIRKVEKMLSHSSLALQSVSMRLSTVSELGDVVAVLAPAKGLLNNVRTEMCGIFPEASAELGNIGNLLTEICTTTSGSSDLQVGNITASADALQILEEAEIAAERRLSDRLPEIGPIGLDGPTGPAPPRRAGVEI